MWKCFCRKLYKIIKNKNKQKKNKKKFCLPADLYFLALKSQTINFVFVKAKYTGTIAGCLFVSNFMYWLSIIIVLSRTSFWNQQLLLTCTPWQTKLDVSWLVWLVSSFTFFYLFFLPTPSFFVCFKGRSPNFLICRIRVVFLK